MSVNLVYATQDDLERHLGTDSPSNAAGLLRRASRMVGVATRRACYDTTPAGMPADVDVADAMREATCLQVEAWVNAGVDPLVTDTGARVSKSTIDGASVEYDTATSAAHQEKLVTTLCSEAWDVLDLAGLLGGLPWVL